MRRLIFWFVGVLLVLVIILQLVPVPRSNPTVTQEVKWDTPQTRALAKRACFDCHSNETVYPWYANIAPVSFILAKHIRDGRESLNFSEWDRPNTDFEEVEEVIEKDQMPLWDYLMMHPEAKFSSTEKEQFLDGMHATFEQDPPIEKEKRERDD